MEKRRSRVARACVPGHRAAWPHMGACLEDRGYLGVRAGQLPPSVPTGPAGKSGDPVA